MQLQQTRITPKSQTTIPKEVRRHLGVAPGKEVEWHIVKSMVIVDAAKKIKDPVKFLTTQMKPLNIDMVKLIREIREEL